MRKLKPDATAADLRGYFNDLKGVAGINGYVRFQGRAQSRAGRIERGRHALGCGRAVNLERVVVQCIPARVNPIHVLVANAKMPLSRCDESDTVLEFIQIAIGGLVVGSIYAAIALGFSLVYRVTGAINLSQGGFALVAAMIGYTFAVAWGWPLSRRHPGGGGDDRDRRACARALSRSCRRWRGFPTPMC